MPILCSMAGADHAIARAGAALVVGQEFRHQEQADALHAGRRVRQAGEHQVDDVLRQVVLARGDEDLAAGDAVACPSGCGAAFVRSRPRSVPQCASVRHHRAGPGAGHHLRQIALLQRVAAMAQDRLARAMRQPGIQAERRVGGGDHLLDLLVQGSPATPARRTPPARPAPSQPPSQNRSYRRPEPGGRAHDAVLIGAAFLVPARVDRQQHRLGKLAGLHQDAVDEVRRDLRQARQAASARRNRAARAGRTACRGRGPCRLASLGPS